MFLSLRIHPCFCCAGLEQALCAGHRRMARGLHPNSPCDGDLYHTQNFEGQIETRFLSRSLQVHSGKGTRGQIPSVQIVVRSAIVIERRKCELSRIESVFNTMALYKTAQHRTDACAVLPQE